MNTSYEKLSFYNSFFGGTIEGDNIMSSDLYGNKTLIGVTMSKYNETLDLLNNYYNKLVELGVIEKEKTPEEIAKEQQELMKSMMLQMQVMQEQIEKMNNKNKEKENVEYESNNKHINKYDEYESKSKTGIESSNRESQGSNERSSESIGSSEKSECKSLILENY